MYERLKNGFAIELLLPKLSTGQIVIDHINAPSINKQ
jgi:hypothetical protein